MFHPLTHKIPYGAATANSPISIRFPLESSLEAERCFLVLRRIFGEQGDVNEQPFRLEMPLLSRGETEDVFALTFCLEDWGIYMYRFEAELKNGDMAFFGRDADGSAVRRDWMPEWQLTVSKCACKTPNWAKTGVVYQIFADRFCRVEGSPFKKRGRMHTYWTDRPDVAEPGKEYRADDFFGGNAKGIASRLDYLKSLGVSLIYLSPIFKSPSNHRYDTSDYLKIDELFGTEEEFEELIKKADALGVKIMLDGVFNHTGADSVYFNKFGNFGESGACRSESSPYFDWYYFYEYPDKYHCWWGSTVVPTVNKSAPGYRKLILGDGGVIEKWMKLGIKGWRLDVVDELPIDFTYALCKKIKKTDDGSLIIGEVWEDASKKISYDLWRPYFMGEQLDGVMNYPFKRAILELAKGGSASDFVAAITSILENYPKQCLDVSLNLVGSHDTVRALTELSGVPAPESKTERAAFTLDEESYALARARLMFASSLQYSLPGVPCVYYGDEAGAQGFEDPLNRGTFPWGQEDETLLSHYRALGKFRAKYADILTGETHFIPDPDIVIFDRASESGTLRIFANPTSLPASRGVCGKDVASGKRVAKRIVVKPLETRFVLLDK